MPQHGVENLHRPVGQAEIDDDIGFADQRVEIVASAPEPNEIELIVRLEALGNGPAHASGPGDRHTNHEPSRSKKRFTVSNQLSARGLCLSPPT